MIFKLNPRNSQQTMYIITFMDTNTGSSAAPVTTSSMTPSTTPATPVVPVTLPIPQNMSAKITYMKANGKNWDMTLSKRLRQYAFESYKMMWMTGEDSAKLDALSQNISFATILLSVIATIAIAGLLAIVDKNQVQWLNYLLVCIGIVLNLFMAILNGYKSAYNLDQVVKIQNDKSVKYGEMYRHIQDQFYLQKENRYDAKMLIEFVRERINELNRECLTISAETSTKWEVFVPKDANDNIDYDQILPLPSELRTDEDANTEFVAVDLIGTTNRMARSLVKTPKPKKKEEEEL